MTADGRQVGAATASPQAAPSDAAPPAWSRFEVFLVAFLIVPSAAYFWHFVQLIDGDFLNSYPFISQDGFDWIYEGQWLAARWSGVELPALTGLRNPVFVWVTATDVWLSANGVVVALVLAAAVFVTHVAMLGIARIMGTPPWLAAAFVTASLVATSGFYRVWVLSDSLAVCLMTVSVWALLSYRSQGGRSSRLVVAATAATLGGLTQAYALIPFCIGVVVFGAEVAIRHKRTPVSLLAGMLLALAVAIGVTIVWRAAIPHLDTPSQFGLLKFTFAMKDFYVSVWAFLLLPFLPLLFVCLSRSAFTDPIVALFGLVVATFVGMSFVYQWPDARFTGIYAPLLLLLSMAAVRRRTASLPDAASASPVLRLALLTAAFATFQGVALAPLNDWAPRWNGVAVRPADTWLGEWISASPVDRFHLRELCGSPGSFCERIRVPDGADSYASGILSKVLAAKQGSRRTSSPTEDR